MNETKRGVWCKVVGMATLGLLMFGGAAVQATSNPVRICEVAKIGAAGVRSGCLAVEQVKSRLGQPSNPARCETQFDQAIAAIDARAAQRGVACRYIDNGDGTVHDLDTLLIWEKKNAADNLRDFTNPHDADNNYTWSATFGGTTPNGTVFTDFLQQLNNCTSDDGATVRGGFAGRCDWRLPTVVELQGIVNPDILGCDGAPDDDLVCIDPIFDPTISSFYWSSTTLDGSPESVWEANFSSRGEAEIQLKGSADFVRAVRGGR